MTLSSIEYMCYLATVKASPRVLNINILLSFVPQKDTLLVEGRVKPWWFTMIRGVKTTFILLSH